MRPATPAASATSAWHGSVNSANNKAPVFLVTVCSAGVGGHSQVVDVSSVFVWYNHVCAM